MTTMKLGHILEKLPTEKAGPEKTKRGELWKQFNVNGNPYLSLAEVDKGLMAMDLPGISNNKTVIMRAFQASKGAHNNPGDKDIGEDYIERSEFRLLFVYLKSYLELWQLFDDIDSGDDKKINQQEFESAIPTMKAWGITLKDPQASFQEADANGSGEILFDEFAHWAIQKALRVQVELGPSSPAPKKKRTVGGITSPTKRTSNTGSPAKKKLSSMDWKNINARLPSAKTDDDKNKRKRLWNSFNVNGNPYLSLAEVDKGCREVLKLPEIANNKMVIMRAFQAAKGVHNAKGANDIGEDYIERSEFRLLFVYLKGYLELWRLFDEIDSSKDKKINRDEFQSAVPTLKKWGIPMENVKETFDEVDVNGGGEILFDEFADWSIRKSLAVEFEVDMAPTSFTSSVVEAKASKDGGAGNEGRAKSSSFDWEAVKAKLPAEKTEAQTALRKKLFDQFDPNGNGYLSLAEVQKGCEEVIAVPEIYENKPVMMRAFQAAKSVSNSSGGSDVGEDYIERSEFRLLLLYLRNYLEIWQIFDEIDTGDDRRISLEEFQSAIPTMEGWGIEIKDAEASFADIDANGGGQVLFDEFADWSIKKSLIIDFEVPQKSPKPALDADHMLDDLLGDDDDLDIDVRPAPASFDWEAVKAKLPAEKTEEQTAQRKELFDRFDPNGNGYLSLAEVQKGCEEVIDVPEIYENKPVMMRAFQAAKGVSNSSSSDIGEDYIERSEFRLLLLYLRNYLEVWQVFDRIDTGDDHRINLEEFKSAVPILEGWGVSVEDAEASFAQIDTNGGGEILFQEFADWSIKKALHLEVQVETPPAEDEESADDDVGASSDEKKSSKPSLDWKKIDEKLPTEKTEEHKALRKALFDGFDPNGNGYLSLAEIQRGAEQVLGLREIYENKPVMMRAYQAARSVANKKGPDGGGDSEDVGEHYIERAEFRLFLVYLRKYLEIWQMFDSIDTGDDRRINLEEFQSALPLLKTWGVEIEDAEATFSEIDANGGGQILFDEFSHWAINKGLELEDDDE